MRPLRRGLLTTTALVSVKCCALLLAGAALSVLAGANAAQAQDLDGRELDRLVRSRQLDLRASQWPPTIASVSTIVPNPALIGGPGAVSGTAFIGNSAGQTGQVTVDGALASWANTGAIIVGNAGTGALSVLNGSVSANSMSIGNDAGAVGTTLVSGAGAGVSVGAASSSSAAPARAP